MDKLHGWRLRCLRKFRQALFWAGMLLGSLYADNAMAATFNSAQSGFWDVGSTWVGGVAPVTGDKVTILNGHTVTVRANAAVDEVIINAGGTLRGDGNGPWTFTYGKGGGVDFTVNANGTLDFATGQGVVLTLSKNSVWGGAGTWNLSKFNYANRSLNLSTFSNTVNFSGNATPITGTTGLITSSSATVWNFTGSTMQTLPNTVNVQYGSIRVSNSTTVTLGIGLNAANLLAGIAVQNGTLSNGGFAIVGTAGNTFSVANGATFLLTGASTMVTGFGSKTFGSTLPTCSTVNYGGTAQTVSNESYGNLTLSGSGAKTMPAAAMTVACNFTMLGTASATATGALTVGGNFSIGATNTFANGANALNVAGNFTQNGTFTAGAGVVTLNGGAAVQTISGTGTLGFTNLTVINTGGITLARNVTVTSAIIGAVTLTSTCPIDYTLTSNGGATVQHSCAGLDHILISHAGSALTCSPQTVTITACANAACTAPHYSGGANVTLTPGGLIFAIDATGINSAATVQQSTAGAVALAATSVPAENFATTCWNTATATASCAMTFSDSGFLVTVPDHVSCNNATATIEAVETAPGTGRCVPAYQNVTRAVNLYSSYANPAAGTQVVTASTGVVSTAAPGTTHSLAFDVNGTATITLSYPDAGLLTLTAGDTAPTGAAMTGSGSFVVAPASFVFSGIPAAPLTAGQLFNATVTARNACGTPAATPNFDGTVTLTSSNPQPGIGNATAINTTLGGFINGAASKNLTWDEVGTIDLNANLANYLGSALSVSGTQAGAGRFHPAYFDTVVTQGCSTFTYAGTTAPVKAGQPFTVMVTANKAGGGITKNYAGALYAYSTTLSNAGVTAGFASNTIAAASFANGVGSANVTYEVATPQTAPLTLTLRATDSDTPAVSSSGYTEGTTEIRSGRARISNAHGSELLNLPVPFRTEYWNNGWVLNPADSCSGDGLLGGAVSAMLATVPPAAWTTCVQDSGILLGLSGAGCAAAGPVGQRFKEGGVIGFAGDFNLWLKAPGTGNTGAVTVTGTAPTWLQHPWGGGAAINPTSRATFGVYKGSNEFIYQRENY